MSVIDAKKIGQAFVEPECVYHGASLLKMHLFSAFS